MMTRTIPSIQTPLAEAAERRRPNRTEYANPHLLTLLRDSNNAAVEPDDGPAGAKDPNELGIDPSKASLLSLLVDGKSVYPSEIFGTGWKFVVAPGNQVLQLAAGYEAEVIKIEIITHNEYDVIPADHPDLLVGWGPFQQQGTAIWRCIRGTASFPSRPRKNVAMIVVHLRDRGETPEPHQP
jgi:hypothetical protein